MRKAFLVWGTVAAVGLLAAAARYLLVEPAAMAHLCDAGSESGWCGVRRAVIASFSGYGLGYAALGVGVMAVALRRLGMAWLGAALGLAGLILYCFEASAVGFLLGALVLARVGGSRPSAGGDMRDEDGGGQREAERAPEDGTRVGDALKGDDERSGDGEPARQQPLLLLDRAPRPGVACASESKQQEAQSGSAEKRQREIAVAGVEGEQ